MAKLKQSHSDAIRQRTMLAIKRIISTDAGIRSRSKLSVRIHTSPQAIHKWENNLGYPTLENIAELCKEFSVSADWLITGTGEMFGDAEVITQIQKLQKRLQKVEQKIGIKKR